MTLLKCSKLLVLTQFFVIFDLAHAYYCAWNLCDVDQYCCGDNICCNNVYSLWYFWAGIVFLIIMLSSCGGFFRYCYAGYRPQIIVHQITNYVPLPTERGYPEETQGLVAYEDLEASHNNPTGGMDSNGYSAPNSPPPPYSSFQDKK